MITTRRRVAAVGAMAGFASPALTATPAPAITRTWMDQMMDAARGVGTSQCPDAAMGLDGEQPTNRRVAIRHAMQGTTDGHRAQSMRDTIYRMHGAGQ